MAVGGYNQKHQRVFIQSKLFSQIQQIFTLLQIMAGPCLLIFAPSGSTWMSCSPLHPSCTSVPSLWIDTSPYVIQSTTAVSTLTPRPASRSWQCGPFQWVSTRMQTQTPVYIHVHAEMRLVPACCSPHKCNL